MSRTIVSLWLVRLSLLLALASTIACEDDTVYRSGDVPPSTTPTDAASEAAIDDGGEDAVVGTGGAVGTGGEMGTGGVTGTGGANGVGGTTGTGGSAVGPDAGNDA